MTARIWPAQSNGVGRVGDGATTVRNASMPAQTGRLMVNTHRQSNVVNKPPSGWPTSPATAPPTAHTPSALARRAGSGKVSRTSDMEAGSMIAAPAPWAQRAAISSPVVGAKAQAAEVTPKMAMPSAIAFLAPIRSARLPANSNSAANTRV